MPPFPLTKFTTSENVTFPDPFAGAVQDTLQDLEFELECVTSPFCNLAFVLGFDQEPKSASKLNPPLVPEGPPVPPIFSVYDVFPSYPEFGIPESVGVIPPLLP